MATNGTTFANRMAIFLWGFAAVWIGILFLFTGLLLRDGPPDGTAPGVILGAMAVFWLGAAGLAGHAMSRPSVRVSVGGDGGVTVTWRYPHRRFRKTYPPLSVPPPRLIEGEDDEGSFYCRVRLTLPDGRVADLAEGHDRESCVEACARLTRALARPD
jgi:hypothetical protein